MLLNGLSFYMTNTCQHKGSQVVTYFKGLSLYPKEWDHYTTL